MTIGEIELLARKCRDQVHKVFFETRYSTAGMYEAKDYSERLLQAIEQFRTTK